MADCRLQGGVEDFCREIETYLCRKNDGHLIRVVGPSFDLVAGWASRGVPLKVARAGIDRYFERYYRKGPRRRPVKIDFCEADVLEVFDEWRRATGVHAAVPQDVDAERSEPAKPSSLPAHLQRIVLRLSSARASCAIGPEFDPIVDRLSAELDAARATAGGVRGDARAAAAVRLEEIDAAMIEAATRSLEPVAMGSIVADAEAELQPFRGGMGADEYARARDAAVRGLIRDRLRLPVLRFA